MSKLIRFDEYHFGYLVDSDLTLDRAMVLRDQFDHFWPGKHFIIMQADEFIDLTRQYELVPIADPVA